MVLNAEEKRSSEQEGQVTKRQLDLLAAWLVAWDGFAVAAAVVCCLSLAGANKHKRHVLLLCEQAVREGRNKLFGVLYDELARQNI